MLEVYLKTQDQRAKEAEFRALSQADEDFTPAWRQAGLPMKPSHLQLDRDTMSGARLVDPKAIMGQYQALKTKEVLKPPHIYEYNDKAISPHYTKTTSNLQVSERPPQSPGHTCMCRPATSNPLQVRQSQLPQQPLDRAHEISLKSRTWHTLSEQEVQQRIAESGEAAVEWSEAEG